MNTIESTTAVRLRNVTKTYDNAVRALQDVSLEVLRGEVVAIIGPSGCGKSTLLRTINGLEKIDSGSIEINGTTVSSEKVRWEEVRQDVGMVFQSYDLLAILASWIILCSHHELCGERIARWYGNKL